MRHNEVELKFLIKSHTDFMRLNEWFLGEKPDRIEYIQGPDDYYRCGNEVVRHRQDGGAGTLTVKKRTSDNSITNRLEVDLTFGPTVRLEDVQAFLLATGYERDIRVIKNASIYWFELDEYHITTVCYVASSHNWETGEDSSKQMFFEIEVEKADGVSVQVSEILLQNFRRKVDERFPGMLGEPMQDSLYEIFSGKRYALAKE